jgi:hypothetical protein
MTYNNARDTYIDLWMIRSLLGAIAFSVIGWTTPLGWPYRLIGAGLFGVFVYLIVKHWP